MHDYKMWKCRKMSIVVVYFCTMVIMTILTACRSTKAEEVYSSRVMCSFSIKDDDANSFKTIYSNEVKDYGLVKLGYNEALSVFKQTMIARLSETFEEEYNSGKYELTYPNDNLRYEWGCMIIEAPMCIKNQSLESFGYILRDLNNDGIEELILVREDHTILAIFTSNGGKAVLLDAYWPRHSCVILDAGEIYVRGSSGASFFEYGIHILEKNSKVLTNIKAFGMYDKVYYEVINKKEMVINQEMFDELQLNYPFELTQQWINTPILPL